MPAFVLVLVANAVLIVVAMRSLTPERDPSAAKPSSPPRADRGEWTAVPATRPTQATPAPTATSAPVAHGSDPTPPPGPAPTTATAAAVTKAAGDGTATKARKPPAKRVSRASAVGAAGRAATKTTNPPAAATAATSTRRRRFSLPPLDDDHEKVNRSIESFLAGGETAQDADAAPTTVAFVALASPMEDGPTDPAIAETLERELQAAARGTDRVDRVAPECWQVTLAATGELAARAYLRAVRAAMEPTLDERHPSLRLVTATATVLDVPVSDATATAERRLASALAAGRGSAAATSEPRAAGD
jgi:hypothetical protein